MNGLDIEEDDSMWLLGMALNHFVNDNTLEAMMVVEFEHCVARDVPHW